MKNSIQKYAACGLILTTLIGGAVGLEIHDQHVDHTKAICPITRILNVIPNAGKVPTGVASHQWPKVKEELAGKGVTDATISYGTLYDTVKLTQTAEPIVVKRNDGSIVYTAPEGFVLTTDDNGKLVCQKTEIIDKECGEGLMAAWGDIIIDGYHISHEHERKLVFNK